MRVESLSEADGDDRPVPQAPSRGRVPCGPDRRGFHRLQGTASAVDPQQAEAGARARLHARRERVSRAPRHSLALAAITWTIRSCFTSAVRNTRSSTCRANRIPACSAATPTGAAPSGCRSMSLLVRALLNLYSFYGDEFKVQCPTGSGQYMTLFEVAQEISRRLASTFLRDARRTAAGLRRDRQVPGRSALARSDPLL